MLLTLKQTPNLISFISSSFLPSHNHTAANMILSKYNTLALHSLLITFSSKWYHVSLLKNNNIKVARKVLQVCPYLLLLLHPCSSPPWWLYLSHSAILQLFSRPHIACHSFARVVLFISLAQNVAHLPFPHLKMCVEWMSRMNTLNYSLVGSIPSSKVEPKLWNSNHKEDKWIFKEKRGHDWTQDWDTLGDNG